MDPGLEIAKWFGEAICASLVGGVATWLTTSRRSRAKVESLASSLEAMRSELEEFDGRIKALEDNQGDARVQSGVDHANAANLAMTVVDLRAKVETTHTLLQQIRGMLVLGRARGLDE
jgi:hypothetical protein